ncbi:MAG TPA: hypothetical protein VJW77_16275 [Terriglobia bacterium]|nr:hypothetical protein [Terriglobia bacterium]
MSIRLAIAGSGQTFSWPEIGLSDESKHIRARLLKILAEVRQPISFSWRETLKDELDEIVRECSEAGWDGYDAEPVSVESVTVAQQLIDALPEHITVPNVVPEPSGEVGLEWRNGAQKYFSLTVSGTELVYAGIFGGFCKRYGEERFFGALPTAVLQILSQYFTEA